MTSVSERGSSGTTGREEGEAGAIPQAGRAEAAAAPFGEDPGPGCLPAILAAGALVLMFAFITCGVSTWYLFQQRTVLAVRTLKSSVIPELEQSGLKPTEKQAVLEILRGVIDDGEQGKLENWQASGIMERLKRFPLLQWGDLEIVEAMVVASADFSEEEKKRARREFSRLRRAAEGSKVMDTDFSDRVLAPVLDMSDPRRRPTVVPQPTTSQLRDVVERAKILADQCEIPEVLEEVSLPAIIRREVEAGKQIGGL